MRYSALALSLGLLAAPLAASEPAVPPPPAPATVSVVLETTMGDIVLAIETERAPISSANFLRYVDQGKYDGITFYRAMKLDWGEQPNGLIQAGTQNDPKRTLPPIAHEPTSSTGLKHSTGAISMARYAPGTAAGDFSIMVSPQPSLDADPAATDEDRKAGYAVFGNVVAGMDVVRAIHAAPADPDKGVGVMKGQMLAQPVKIVDARRATIAP